MSRLTRPSQDGLSFGHDRAPAGRERSKTTSEAKTAPTATSSSSSSSSSSLAWPSFSFGLPTAYTHEQKRPNLDQPQTYLPASMNPGAATSFPSDYSATASASGWFAWQNILKERDMVAREGATHGSRQASLGQSSAFLRKESGSFELGGSSGSGRHSSSPTQQFSHGQAALYRPPSVGTSGSEAGGNQTAASSIGWARSQQSSQTSLRSFPSPHSHITKASFESDLASKASRPARGHGRRGTAGSMDTKGSQASSTSASVPRGSTNVAAPPEEHKPPTESDAPAELWDAAFASEEAANLPPAAPEPSHRQEGSDNVLRAPLSPIPGSHADGQSEGGPSVPTTPLAPSHAPSSKTSPPRLVEPPENVRLDVDVALEASRQYALLQALYRAELEEHSTLMDDGVLTAKNGCETVFMPRPRLSSSYQRRTSGTWGVPLLCGDESDDEGKDAGRSAEWDRRRRNTASPVQAATFERNRKLAKMTSRQRLAAAASTPNLSLPEGDQPSMRVSLDLKKSSHPAARKAGSKRGTAASSRYPSDTTAPPGAARSRGATKVRGRSQSDPPTPSRPTAPQGGLAPPTPPLDPSHSTSTLSDSLQSSLDLHDVIKEGQRLEEERSRWRAEFQSSFECRSRSRSRARSATKSRLRSSSTPKELPTREEVLSAGPQKSRFNLSSLMRKPYEEALMHGSPYTKPYSKTAANAEKAGGDTAAGQATEAQTADQPPRERTIRHTRSTPRLRDEEERVQAAEIAALSSDDGHTLCLPRRGRKARAAKAALRERKPTDERRVHTGVEGAREISAGAEKPSTARSTKSADWQRSHPPLPRERGAAAEASLSHRPSAGRQAPSRGFTEAQTMAQGAARKPPSPPAGASTIRFGPVQTAATFSEPNDQDPYSHKALPPIRHSASPTKRRPTSGGRFSVGEEHGGTLRSRLSEAPSPGPPPEGPLPPLPSASDEARKEASSPSTLDTPRTSTVVTPPYRFGFLRRKPVPSAVFEEVRMSTARASSSEDVAGEEAGAGVERLATPVPYDPSPALGLVAAAFESDPSLLGGAPSIARPDSILEPQHFYSGSGIRRAESSSDDATASVSAHMHGQSARRLASDGQSISASTEGRPSLATSRGLGSTQDSAHHTGHHSQRDSSVIPPNLLLNSPASAFAALSDAESVPPSQMEIWCIAAGNAPRSQGEESEGEFHDLFVRRLQQQQREQREAERERERGAQRSR